MAKQTYTVRGEVESYREGSIQRADWSVGVTLGEGLTRPAKRAVKVVIGQVGGLGKRLVL